MNFRLASNDMTQTSLNTTGCADSGMIKASMQIKISYYPDWRTEFGWCADFLNSRGQWCIEILILRHEESFTNIQIYA